MSTERAALSWNASLDITLISFFAIFRNRHALLEFSKLYISPAIVIDFLKAGVVVITILNLVRYIRGLKATSSTSEGLQTKPVLFPCKTSHTRWVPKSHSFEYSYLWVGIPVGWKGQVGGMLSADLPKSLSPWYSRLLSISPGDAWHTVNGDDYLDRGHLDGGLAEKLKSYLESQSIDSNEYPYAYLLTAPRFLNYASNPVSIWNLYSAQKELKAFILEVNNTFDERHIYFVKPEAIPPLNNDLAMPPKLINTWPKDFYVSVFNSRAGEYSVSATDPLYPSMTGSGAVNTTITIKSPHARLVARIFSTSPALDPDTMSVFSKTHFLLSWWWVGLATFPRTVVQAVTLVSKRKMAWVFRPEPRRDTMPRHADATEILIEQLFRAYLRSLVELSEEELVISYVPAGVVGGKVERMLSATIKSHDGAELEFRVLTPIFYSRFVHYSNTNLHAILLAEHNSGTISLSDTTLFSNLKSSSIQQPISIYNQPLLRAIQYLRHQPPPIEDIASSAPPSPTTGTFEIFISEHVALGWMELLDLEIFILRSIAAWMVSRWLILG